MPPSLAALPGWALIPADVLTDARLSARDVRIFGLLALARRGRYVSLGRQRLAQYAHADRRGVRSSIKALIEFGHIEEQKEPLQRARFKLLSDWFGEVAGEVAVARPAAKLVRELVRCPKCGKQCGGLLKVGWCRSCNTEKRIERIADRRIAIHQEERKTA